MDVKSEETQVVQADAPTLPASQGSDCEARCSACGEVVELDTVGAPRHAGSKPTCKACNSLTKMLFRNIGKVPEMSVEKTSEFYRRCLAAKGRDDLLNWKRVRGFVVQTMSEVIKTRRTQTTAGTFQPLTWYEKQGYCVEDIEARAASRECPILGKVYLLPLISISDEEIHEQAEEYVDKLERDVKRRKVPEEPKAKRAKKGEPVETPAQLTDAQKELKLKLQNVIDLESDEDDKVVVPKGKTGKQLEAEKQKALAKEEAEAKKQSEKQVKQSMGLASKAFSMLKPQVEKLLKVKAACEKLYDMEPFQSHPNAIEEFDQTLANLDSWSKEASVFLKNATGNEKVEPLSFGAEQLKLEMKAAAQMVKVWNTYKKDALAKMKAAAK